MRSLALGRRFEGILAWDSVFHLPADDQRAMFPRLYHASLAPAEYESLLAANGFAVRDFIGDDGDCGGHTVWLAVRNQDARDS